jgi:hypothetical protein
MIYMLALVIVPYFLPFDRSGERRSRGACAHTTIAVLCTPHWHNLALFEVEVLLERLFEHV